MTTPKYQLGPVIGQLGGSGGIAPADPVPLHTYWLELGEARSTGPSRAIFYAAIVTSVSGSNWGAPYPRLRWREITTGETVEHEFPRTNVSNDEMFVTDLTAGTWVAEITGSGHSDRTAFTYKVTAAVAPID